MFQCLILYFNVPVYFAVKLVDLLCGSRGT